MKVILVFWYGFFFLPPSLFHYYGQLSFGSVWNEYRSIGGGQEPTLLKLSYCRLRSKGMNLSTVGGFVLLEAEPFTGISGDFTDI